MKKVVAVIGSPHDERSNTAALTRRFLAALADEYKGPDGLVHRLIPLGGKRIGACKGCLYLFGTIPLGHLQAVGYRPGELPWRKAYDRKIGALARRAARVLEYGHPRPGWRNDLYFWAMKLKAKYGAEWLPHEHRYWAEKGWFAKSYRQAARREE